MPKVVVTARSFRQLRGQHWKVLEDAGLEIVTPPVDRPLSEAELIPLLKDADAALVGVDEVTAQVIASAPRLKVISKHGVGVDAIDVAAATRRGVAVTNTPGANQVAVAEFAVALILSLARRIPSHDLVVRAGKWNRQIGIELADKTVGIVGLGRIGKEVALRLEAFRMRLVAYDVFQDRVFASEHAVEFVPLDQLLSQSDFVTLHATLNAESHFLIGEKELALFKPTAFLVNTARGGLVDEAALYRALSENRLAGSALDVFADEPPKDSPLLQLGDKVILTPHLGAQTRETVQRMGTMAAQNLVQALKGIKPAGIVNPEVFQVAREVGS
ncbi:MAG: phosphoglycerate dehydrogenase [Chloroflexi bacterium]|nr:phosphoglycerate dehydrogenase [Chloroflexota bacterium]